VNECEKVTLPRQVHLGGMHSVSFAEACEDATAAKPWRFTYLCVRWDTTKLSDQIQSQAFLCRFIRQKTSSLLNWVVFKSKKHIALRLIEIL